MKFLVLTLTMLCAFSLFASDFFGPGDGDTHTEDFCSTLSPAICGHIKFLTPIDSTSESQFIVQLLPGVEGVLVQDLSVVLWMQMGGHGHGSSPVTIEDMGKNHFRVTEAYFVMKGQWLVKVAFKLNGVAHKLEIPVQVL